MPHESPAKTIAPSGLFRLIPFLVLGLSIYYYLALISFSPYDNSFFSALVPAKPTANLAGSVGSTLGAYGIYYFGLLAYLLPMILGSLIIYLPRKKPAALLAVFFSGIAAFCLSGILLRRYQPEYTIEHLAFASEGFAGAYLVATVEGLFGWWGTLILSTTTLLAFVVPPRWLSLLLTYLTSILKTKLLLPLQALGRNLGVKLGEVSAWSNNLLTAAPRFLGGLLKHRGQKIWRRSTTPPMAAAMHDTHPVISSQPAPLLPLNQIPPLTSAAPSLALKNTDPLPASAAIDTAAFAEIFPVAHPSSLGWGAEEELRRHQLEEFFTQFKIPGTVIDLHRGPFVTTYVFKPKPGTKQNAIFKLAGDLALHLQVESIFAHPLHAQSAIGIQIPNRSPAVIHFADLIQSPEFRQFKEPLPLALGVDVYGKPVFESLAQMPHLLLAGSTGSGKSVGLHSFICSLLSKTTPEELKLIFIDPKRLELTFYEGIPYLLRPIITEIDQAQEALTWAIDEMEQRYRLLQQAKVRTIEAFNRWWGEQSSSERRRFSETSAVDELSSLPYLVIVIDELADLILQSSGTMSKSITLLVQKARACGIHLILATQRPSVDVVTGLIKANLPARISYRLTSSYDSRTILDQLGAEKLLGRGDMLWHKPGAGQLQRLHGAYITDEEIRKLVNWLTKEYA